MGGEIQVILARAYAGLRDFAAAEQVLAEARQEQKHLLWIPPLLDALEAELRLKQGDLAAASRWAEQQDIPEDLERILSQWILRSTYIRVMIAQGKLEVVPRLLNQLETMARQNQRHVLLINIHALQALAHTACGENSLALERLELALKAAAPGGYIGRFLDLGPQMAELLAEYCTSPAGQSAPQEVQHFAREILAAFGDQEGNKPLPQAKTAPLPALPERLTEHELKILRLISAGLSNQDIADALVIGVGTVKWHVHNILSKLDATSRTQAIARAKEAGLI
jgi:LuxR family maltose regulon positive regulatory protein